MRKLLDFLIQNILDKESKYEIIETNEDNIIKFVIRTESENMGLIIGKGGKTIKTLRNLLRVRATLERTGVYLSAEELK